MKAQPVRLADVFIIGPLMIWGGARAIRDQPIPGAALAIFGVATILYNARNYLQLQKGQP